MKVNNKQFKQINVAYCRISTRDQHFEKYKPSILDYANKNDFGKVEFVNEVISGKKPWRERKLFQVIEGMNEADLFFGSLQEISK